MRTRLAEHLGRVGGANVVLLVALLALVGLGPFLHPLVGGGLALFGLVSLVLVAAVASVAGSRRQLLTSGVLFALAIGAAWLGESGPGPGWLGGLAGLLVVAFLCHAAGVLIWHAVKTPGITTDTLAATASVYVCLGLVWAIAYLRLAAAFPGEAFSTPGGGPPTSEELFYFSFVTLTTLGYGDVRPAMPETRALAVLQALVGVLFVAVFIGRIVGSYVGTRRTEE